MLLSKSEAKSQIAKLIKEYPNLRIISENTDEIVVAGVIQFSRIFNDFPITKIVQLEITIPIEQECFPCVKDIGGDIDIQYPHKYLSGMLCLATEIDMKLHFRNGFDLLQWMADFVEPYYYSHDYYQRFRCYPFGDRAHGYVGIIQSYCDWFSTQKVDIVMPILRHIETNDNYRGHHLCFCGSGKKMRDCHGQKILPFYQYSSLREQLKKDLSNLRKELKK